MLRICLASKENSIEALKIKSLKQNKHLESILHLGLWILLLLVFISLTSQVFPTQTAIILCSGTILLLAIVAYFNALVIIPNLFKEGRFWWYALAIIALLIGATYLNTIYSTSILSEITPERPSEFSKHRRNMSGRIGFRFFRLIPSFFLVLTMLFISTLYKLARAFLDKEHRNTQLEKEKIQHELNFLRSQINPHFLFNALNNLHAIVQLNPQQAGDYVLKLGEMLRYVLEDCKNDNVSLAAEIKYIENYIFFQKQKDENLENIFLKIEGEDPSTFYVEPMLFIALVENAFQHSYTENPENQIIQISIYLTNEQIQFTTINNLGSQEKNIHPTKPYSLGMGLKNVKRRLELLYPDHHHLSYGIKGDKYKAELIIQKALV